jgi:hypothetical protein
VDTTEAVVVGLVEAVEVVVVGLDEAVEAAVVVAAFTTFVDGAADETETGFTATAAAVVEVFVEEDEEEVDDDEAAVRERPFHLSLRRKSCSTLTVPTVTLTSWMTTLFWLAVTL